MSHRNMFFAPTVFALVALMASAGCAIDGTAPANGDANAASANEALRALLPGEEVGVLPAGAKATIRYDGTTFYRAYRIVLTAESDVRATVTALRSGASALAWISTTDAHTVTSGGPSATVQLTSTKLAAGTYFIVFRDLNRVAGDFTVQVAITPTVVPPPPPSPSILLPAGKNGAAAKRTIVCSIDGLVVNGRTGVNLTEWKATAVYTKTCDGFISEKAYVPAKVRGELVYQATACAEVRSDGVWHATQLGPASVPPSVPLGIALASSAAEPAFYYNLDQDRYDNSALNGGRSIDPIALLIGPTRASASWNYAEVRSVFPKDADIRSGGQNDPSAKCSVEFTY